MSLVSFHSLFSVTYFKWLMTVGHTQIDPSLSSQSTLVASLNNNPAPGSVPMSQAEGSLPPFSTLSLGSTQTPEGNSTKKKRYWRTKEEMQLYNKEKARKKQVKDAEKAFKAAARALRSQVRGRVFD